LRTGGVQCGSKCGVEHLGVVNVFWYACVRVYLVGIGMISCTNLLGRVSVNWIELCQMVGVSRAEYKPIVWANIGTMKRTKITPQRQRICGSTE
jgi:hypothetical protein